MTTQPTEGLNDPWFHDCPACGAEAKRGCRYVKDLQSIGPLMRERDAWNWLAANVSMELTWGEVDNDPSDCEWRVHRRHGGYNDREWDLIATGSTPLDAVCAALKRIEGQG